MEYKIFTSVGMLTLNVPVHERATSTGERYMECPICTPLRKPEHRGEKKLAVNVQEGAWRCNHCEEGGYLHTDKEIEEKIKPLTYSPNYKPVNDGIYKFFNGRTISKATVDHFRIKQVTKKILQIHSKNDELRGKWASRSCIAFPMLNDSKLINVQYRDPDKNFAMEPGAEKILYNIDAIKPKTVRRALIVEGYIDCMSYHEAGVTHVVSVPNGATISPNEIKVFQETGKILIDKPLGLSYLDPFIDLLQSKDEIIIGTDDDAAGVKLREELARRIGREKCRYIKYSIWKTKEGKPCKDGNDILVNHGPKEVLKSVESAEFFPVSGIVTADQIYDTLLANYDKDYVKGKPIGLKCLDPHITLHLGHTLAINGYPSMGKTSFILWLLVYVAVVFKWKSIVYTPENYPIENVFEHLIEIYIGKSAKPDAQDRMSKVEFERGMKFIKEYIILIDDKDDDGYSPKELVKMFKNAIHRYGVNVCAFDPWNSLDHKRDAHYNLDDYAKKMLSNITRFTTRNNVLTIIGVHPPTPEKTSSKIYNAPSMFDIEMGSVWAKKMYEIMCLHKPSDEFQDTSVELHVQKIKHHKTTGVPTPRSAPAIAAFNRRSNRFEDSDGFDPLAEALREKAEQIEFEF